MSPRTKITRLRAAFVVALVLPWACTDNPATRTLDDPYASTNTGGSAGSGGKATGGSSGSTGTGGSTGGSSGAATGGSAGTSGEGGGGGGPTVDPCLPPCDDPDGCVLTPEEEAMVNFCHLYAQRCPDQPADVMTNPGNGQQVPAGPDAPSTATRPQLSEDTADELYTIEKTFEGGGEYTVSYSGEGAGGEGGGPSGPLGTRTVSYANGEWDPRGEIEDVTKIVPGIVVDPNGNKDVDGTYQTLQSAILAAGVVAGCPRVFIKVLPGTYREKIIVPSKTSAPPLTIYGVDRDPTKIVIVAGHSAAGDEAACTPLTIHNSATFTNSLPQPFQARNFTIQNDYVEGTCPGDPDDQTAVALNNQADQAMFDNIRILGHRNALYVKSEAPNEVSRVYFRNCYVEGDEDIILGRGAAVLDQCRIHSLGDRVSGGAIAATSTRVDNPHGLLIINSELTADARVSNVFLGHQWYEGNEELAVGKSVIRNSILGSHIRTGDVYAPTERTTPKNPTPTSTVLYTSDDYYAPGTGLVPPETYLAEFGNSGPGAAQ